MKDVSELLDEDFHATGGKVKHATGTQHRHRGHSIHDDEPREPVHPAAADGGPPLPVEPDVRPDFGRG